MRTRRPVIKITRRKKKVPPSPSHPRCCSRGTARQTGLPLPLAFSNSLHRTHGSPSPIHLHSDPFEQAAAPRYAGGGDCPGRGEHPVASLSLEFGFGPRHISGRLASRPRGRGIGPGRNEAAPRGLVPIACRGRLETWNPPKLPRRPMSLRGCLRPARQFRKKIYKSAARRPPRVAPPGARGFPASNIFCVLFIIRARGRGPGGLELEREELVGAGGLCCVPFILFGALAASPGWPRASVSQRRRRRRRGRRMVEEGGPAICRTLRS
jgi:hypothetical protein